MNILPGNFPRKVLSDADRYRVEGYYQRFVETYYREYQFGHFIFAGYAAVPTLLTPDLLYKIWQNFGEYNWGSQAQRIHRIAVADLLLSPLCREVGYELYEMLPEIRMSFLGWLKNESDNKGSKGHGIRTPEDIARFTTEYHAKPNPGLLRFGEGYNLRQGHGSLVFHDHAQLQHLLTAQLRQSIQDGEQDKTLELLDFWAKSADQLERIYKNDGSKEIQPFLQNASLATAWKNLIQQDEAAFVGRFEQDARLRNLLTDTEEGGIRVEMPLTTARQVEALPKARLYAVLVGIDQYASPSIQPLRGCVLDIEGFAGLLPELSAQKQLQPDIRSLSDAHATYANVIQAFDLLDAARDGDYFLFYFAGHSHSEAGMSTGRQFVLHDSRTGEVGDLSQGWIEERVFPVLQQRAVQCIFIIDTHEVKEATMKSALLRLPLRKNAESLRGGLLLLNATSLGENAQELLNGGVFSVTLREVLRESGAALSYGGLMESVRLRMRSLENNKQTPYLEAFPSLAGENLFLSDKREGRQSYKIVFDAERRAWILEAGSVQGITPSLGFMFTYLRLKELPDTRAVVRDVFAGQSTLLDFPEKDHSRVFTAFLAQKALPKVNISFDPQLDATLRSAFEQAVREHDIYYIEITESIREARYYINSREGEYFLSRTMSGQSQDPLFQPKPLFTTAQQPFDFIRQIEYIAQWTGVLEYNRSSPAISAKAVDVQFEILEGQHFKTMSGLEQAVAGTTLLNPESLELRYVDGQQPAFRCALRTIGQHLYVAALYLDSTYGIQSFGYYEMSAPKNTRGIGFPDEAPWTYIQIEAEGQMYRTLPLKIGKEYLERDTREITSFLKLFLSDQPIDFTPLLQKSLRLDFRGVMRGDSIETTRQTLDLQGTEWRAVTIPIRILYEEQQAKPEAERGAKPSSAAEGPPLATWKALIAQDETVKAIDAVMNHLRAVGDTSRSKDLALWGGRLKSLQKEFEQGLIANDEYNLGRCEVNYALLNLIKFGFQTPRPAISYTGSLDFDTARQLILAGKTMDALDALITHSPDKADALYALRGRQLTLFLTVGAGTLSYKEIDAAQNAINQEIYAVVSPTIPVTENLRADYEKWRDLVANNELELAFKSLSAYWTGQGEQEKIRQVDLLWARHANMVESQISGILEQGSSGQIAVRNGIAAKLLALLPKPEAYPGQRLEVDFEQWRSMIRDGRTADLIPDVLQYTQHLIDPKWMNEAIMLQMRSISLRKERAYNLLDDKDHKRISSQLDATLIGLVDDLAGLTSLSTFLSEQGHALNLSPNNLQCLDLLLHDQRKVSMMGRIGDLLASGKAEYPGGKVFKWPTDEPMRLQFDGALKAQLLAMGETIGILSAASLEKLKSTRWEYIDLHELSHVSFPRLAQFLEASEISLPKHLDAPLRKGNLQVVNSVLKSTTIVVTLAKGELRRLAELFEQLRSIDAAFKITTDYDSDSITLSYPSGITLGYEAKSIRLETDKQGERLRIVSEQAPGETA
jgi:hypothetical protein